MIGVLAKASEDAVVKEFFELFKTPWEGFQKERSYDVVLSTTDDLPAELTAQLVLVYGAEERLLDAQFGINARPCEGDIVLTYDQQRVPLYNKSAVFPGSTFSPAIEETSCHSVLWRHEAERYTLVRIGYDLFKEIKTLLCDGQPVSFAAIPTLDLHISLLRELIVSAGVSLIEVPPVPQSHPFIACLTHDVDHPSLRLQKWGSTTAGFLFRAVVGTTRNWFRRRVGFHDVITNWYAALKLPFVMAGLARDPWKNFLTQYNELEGEGHSTFFVIPFSNCPSVSPKGKPAPRSRASSYGAADIAETVAEIEKSGHEVGLHGIDAWIDVGEGEQEFAEIRRLTSDPEIGVRMHWLYYNNEAPVVLERLGAAYDSTVGYRETAGFRNGTTQAYKPLNASRLLELPMHAMDTALFYPDCLNLSANDALSRLAELVDCVAFMGGCLTFNWHDRSLAPERLWHRCYRGVICRLKEKGAWFATAREATRWFKRRRSVVFERVHQGTTQVHVRCTEENDSIPGLRLRVYSALGPEKRDQRASSVYTDVPLTHDTTVGPVLMAGDLQVATATQVNS